MNIPEEIAKKLDDLHAAYIKTAREEFTKGFNDLFARYPRLISVGWRQYTPYFNDGNECTFRCNKDDPVINGYDHSYGDTEPNGFEDLVTATDKEAEQIIKEVEEFLEAFNEELMETLFDNHVCVHIDRDGIETSHYQHE